MAHFVKLNFATWFDVAKDFDSVCLTVSPLCYADHVAPASSFTSNIDCFK